MPEVALLRQNAAVDLARKTEEDSSLVRLLPSLQIPCDQRVAPLSFAVCLLPFGCLGVGKTVGSYPKLRVMGRTIAGILKGAPHFLRQLRRKLNRLQAVADHGGTAIDRLKSQVCKAMVTLLQNWCPLVLCCVLLVRQRNWSGRHPGTAIDAQNVLRLVFSLLSELRRAAADAVVYPRTIGVALLHWQTFDSGLPGLCYGEEFGEVMLSRLGCKKGRHTLAVTPSDVEDLFVQICSARMNRGLLVSGLSADIETEVRQRLHSYVIDNRLRILCTLTKCCYLNARPRNT